MIGLSHEGCSGHGHVGCRFGWETDWLMIGRSSGTSLRQSLGLDLVCLTGFKNGHSPAQRLEVQSETTCTDMSWRCVILFLCAEPASREQKQWLSLVV